MTQPMRRPSKPAFARFATIGAAICVAGSARAGIAIGTGLSSATSGRTVPALALGWSEGTWAVSGLATGVKTTLYSHSAWTMNAYRTMPAGELGWGPLTVGIGVGLAYSTRKYRDVPSGPVERADDGNFGPAFRVSWFFFGPAYLAVEAMYGLKRPGPLLLLSAQDHANLTLGAAF